MASLRRENLVRDGKFNRAEIMKRAWAYYRNPFNTCYRGNFKRALQEAWLDAKLVMDESKKDSAPKFNPNVSLSTLRSASSSIDMRTGTVCW